MSGEMRQCRTALVTGATSGLGLAMAAALAGAGLRVALTGRSADRADAAAAGLPGAFGLAMDVRDEESVAAGVGPCPTAPPGPARRRCPRS